MKTPFLLEATRSQNSIASDSPRSIPRLVAGARRRSLLVLLVEELASVAAVTFGVFLLALLFGTDVVSLFFVLFSAVVAFSVGIWRVRGRLPSSYSAAQILDRQLRLQDTVSTAWFLLTPAGRSASPTAGAFQVEQAESAARAILPGRAFPFRGQRRWAIAGVLGLIACGFFGARYLVNRTLSLRPPLVGLRLDSLMEGAERALGTKELDKPLTSNSQTPKNANLSANQGRAAENRDAEQLPPLPAAPKTDSNGSGSSPHPSSSPGARQPGAAKSTGAAESAKTGNDPDSRTSSREQAGSNSPTAAPNSSSERGQSSPNQGLSPKDGANNTPGLMSRLKDALSSVMAKMTPQNGGQKTAGTGDQSDQKGQNAQQASKSGEQPSQQGTAGQDKAASEQNASGQGDGQTAEKAGGSQGRSNSNSKNEGRDSQSGVGSQDGDKQLRDAEQQQAMGKLAEILGKRSANLTGDMTVETPSGNQQLKTSYTHQQGRHFDSGGEINRNEVPLRYRQYVQDYMEAVRKTQNSTPVKPQE